MHKQIYIYSSETNTGYYRSSIETSEISLTINLPELDDETELRHFADGHEDDAGESSVRNVAEERREEGEGQNDQSGCNATTVRVL